MNTFCKWLAPAVALGVGLLSAAQAADPTEAKTPAQSLRYESAFADYKPWRDIKPGDWRQLNANVSPARPAAPSAAPKASAPTAPAHQGHHMHGGKQ